MSLRIYKRDGEWAAYRRTGDRSYGVTGCANPLEAWWHTSRLADWIARRKARKLYPDWYKS